jgi:anti-sigma regulatory factor (Ser/Thr protein kinase)
MADEIVVEATIDNIEKVQDFVDARLVGYPAKTLNQIRIVIDEICSNIVRHGYREHAGDMTVRVGADDGIEIEFEDSGLDYDPLGKADPDVTLLAEDREIGGLGVYMVKQLMDSVEYRREDGKNILTVKKTL